MDHTISHGCVLAYWLGYNQTLFGEQNRLNVRGCRQISLTNRLTITSLLPRLWTNLQAPPRARYFLGPSACLLKVDGTPLKKSLTLSIWKTALNVTTPTLQPPLALLQGAIAEKFNVNSRAALITGWRGQSQFYETSIL